MTAMQKADTISNSWAPINMNASMKDVKMNVPAKKTTKAVDIMISVSLFCCPIKKRNKASPISIVTNGIISVT